MFNMFSFSRSPRNQSNPSRKFGKKRTYKYPAKSAKKVLPTIAEEDYNLDPQPQNIRFAFYSVIENSQPSYPSLAPPTHLRPLPPPSCMLLRWRITPGS